jgi:guanosine-3',5'-bis(diphosphate) 3'-pyrophosphohydrolase
MTNRRDERYRPLLEAVAFTARAHDGQLRKDGETPYASHAFRVCLIARHVFGVDDPSVLAAAVLHDTLEDTPTDYDDLAERFGAEVAAWVAALSKDMRLPEPEREEAYETTLARAPWQVKVCKLADVFDNLTDARQTPPEQRARTFRRARRYLQALRRKMPRQVKPAWAAVARLLDELEARG